MACAITAYTLDCREDVGGVKKVFLYGGDDFTVTATAGVVTSFIVDDDAQTPESITSIALLEASTNVVTINQGVQEAGVAETGNFSSENGSAFYQTELTINLTGMTADNQQRITNIGRNRRILAIVEDNNGRYWFVGNDNGCIATASTGGLGTAFGDQVGHKMTLTGFSKEAMWEFDPA